jgi:CBS domain-containing protein
MKIKKIICHKDRYNRVYSISADADLVEGAKKLAEYNSGALLITEPGSDPVKYIGIASERDIVRHLARNYEDLKKMKMADIMTKDMVVADIEDDVDYIVRIMTQKKIRHIPVVENGKVVGLLSVRHVIEALYEEDEMKIRYLSDYVYGQKGSDVF